MPGAAGIRLPEMSGLEKPCSHEKGHTRNGHDLVQRARRSDGDGLDLAADRVLIY